MLNPWAGHEQRKVRSLSDGTGCQHGMAAGHFVNGYMLQGGLVHCHISCELVTSMF